MAKLLYRRQKNKGQQETYYIKDTTSDYHCKHGKIPASELSKPDGTLIKSHTDEEFYVFTANFSDTWSRLKRLPQSMVAKDIGAIIALCGIGHNTIIAEAGSGNASLGTQLAHVAKHVYSYDIKESHLSNAQKNTKQLDLHNITFTNADIADQETPEKVDVMILDVPQPWDALESAHRNIKPGGLLVTYSPSTTQVQKTKTESLGKFLHLQTSEIIQRDWAIGERICRPDNIAIGHTAFLSIFRRLY